MGVCVSKDSGHHDPSTVVTKVQTSGPSILTRTQDIKDYYNFDATLGQGHFGVVRLVVEKTTGTRFACKSISKRKLATQEEISDVRREINILHHLAGHPHVVDFKAAYEDKQHLHLVMELCQGGELFTSIVQRKFYSERDAAEVMRQIVGVVAHCHSMGVIHRDLKPENFLLSCPSGGSSPALAIKATDFGLSAWLKDGEVLTDVVGSPYYIAPEVLEESYTHTADIWSCGVILYTLLCGWPPFFGETTQAIFQAILHTPIDFQSDPWDTISDAGKDCVQSMLVRDPAKRATAAEVLSHEWLADNGAALEKPMEVEVLSRLKKFAAMNKFKREVVRVMVGTLPCEELVGMQEMFAAMDRDHSGGVSVEELRESLRARGADVTSDEIQKLVEAMDMDGSNTIDMQEFVAATVYLGRLEREDHLYTAFAHFDKDGSGFISRSEILQAVEKLPDAAASLDSILAEIDRNEDGRVDYGEFCTMVLGSGGEVARAASSLRRGILVDVAPRAPDAL